MAGKAFSAMDKDELNHAIDEKKALPDMALKRMYFSAQESMTMAEANLMYSYYRDAGYFNDLLVFKFRSSILTTFRLISGMIYDAKVLDWSSQSKGKEYRKKYKADNDYELCLLLTRYSQLDVHTLIHLAGYLNHALHTLGLTDLLINTNDGESDFRKMV